MSYTFFLFQHLLEEMVTDSLKFACSFDWKWVARKFHEIKEDNLKLLRTHWICRYQKDWTKLVFKIKIYRSSYFYVCDFLIQMVHFHPVAPCIFIHTCKWSSQNNIKPYFTSILKPCRWIHGGIKMFSYEYFFVHIAQRCICLASDKNLLKAKH